MPERHPSFQFDDQPGGARPRRPSRWPVVLVLLVIALAAVGVWVWMSPESVKPWVDVEQLLRGTPLATRPGTTRLYKWRDERGQWQVSDRPPPPGIDYERLDYRSDTNVLPPMPGTDAGDR